jgi:microcystin-dependent protein
MFCEGQLLPISENETLFQLIGTTYGGDGESTFALPDLRGRLPLHMGQGPGISNNYVLGEALGVEEVTLTTQQLPVHNHPFIVSAGNGPQPNPAGNFLAASTVITAYAQETPSAPLTPGSLGAIGGSQPHTNFQPYLCVNFIISLFGIFPQPN